MDVHGVVSLPPSVSLDETRSDSLDLNSSLRLSLDVLNKESLHADARQLWTGRERKETHTRPDDLGSDVEVTHGLDFDEDFLFRPLPLKTWLHRQSCRLAQCEWDSPSPWARSYP